MDGSTLSANLRNFTGSDEIYRYKLFGRELTVKCDQFADPKCTVCYTQGVKYLCEKAQAYWLLDAIASHLPHVVKNPEAQTIHFWTLAKPSVLNPAKHKIILSKIPKDTAAVLLAQVDEGLKPLVVQYIPYTDFPFDTSGQIKIFAGATSADFGNIFNIHLPSEH
jgi:hypothetical protein